MRESLTALIAALILTVVVLALVGVGLSHTQAMGKNADFMASMEHHMEQDHHVDHDENASTSMNVTQHAHGDMYTECEETRDRMNMTDPMLHMR